LSDHAEQGSYGQFCPVAMASEVLCSRWTMLVLREMICGSTRFNDLRRGVPRMSPTLLSKRLKELIEGGVITERRTGQGNAVDYVLTDAGRDLRDVVMAVGTWGQRWVQTSVTLKNLDPSLLMWDMRRQIATAALPDRRCVVQFVYPELGAGRKSWWLLMAKGEVDLCTVDPGHDVDLYVHGSLRSMTSVWMGISTLDEEIEAGAIRVTGDESLGRSMRDWLGLSPFAKEPKRVAP
jgi:DNA-binding HxlR family transcriptional regulator